ncbi:putative N-acetylmannosamine-6-phosphate 2-epimerase [Devosia rhodophyticola]|uniref:N-acylglucosamine-6-phosphate 2-epimerase n=1 Tax=Devosia rhodophyticola TaxID=3026423 RepID=A0ABY7Z0S4_9HYPH|nr:putative N-acetylmannosamine-6-phosphate 2-epimerase [Devosia rhodophyticola]WDR07253.1 putative N-acetylmannosamine-6-phosphate 2-epimerase [Devosia rhodophyticola]
MLLDSLKHRLIVSCQPVTSGPMDNAEAVVGFALAAEVGGASALRIESIAYLKAVRPRTKLPIVGIVKRDLDDSPIRITPYIDDAVGLCEAGADIVAFDATDRVRPATISALIVAIHGRGKLAMADCSSLDDAKAALAAGVDCIGSTLSGYVGGTVPDGPDFELIEAMQALTPYVIAEGRIKFLDDATQALRRGAHAVVVGSAITRTEHVTEWFEHEVARTARALKSPVLAIDIGGTKILATLITNGRAGAEMQIATDRKVGPDHWIAEVAEAVKSWGGQYGSVGCAVTGLIDDGVWSPLNKSTLNIPERFPLVARLASTFGVPAFAANDAQSAAWGEFRHGAGAGQDMVFLTISTGIGGGIVVNGRLLGGLAGHYGILRSPSTNKSLPIEDEVSGRWIAAEAERAGHRGDAATVFVAARAGEAWADAIIANSASTVALLCQDIQLTLDPQRIVVGGGIGLADGYLDRVRAALPDLGPRCKPQIVSARCGRHAGAIGVAELAATAL